MRRCIGSLMCTKRTSWAGLAMSVDWGGPETLESCPTAASAVGVSTGSNFRAGLEARCANSVARRLEQTYVETHCEHLMTSQGRRIAGGHLLPVSFPLFQSTRLRIVGVAFS